MAVLYRYRYSNMYTQGILISPGLLVSILEPPWKGNQRNISCIPKGVYNVDYMDRSSSGQYHRCYHIIGVPGRGGILCHPGNAPDNTRGCLLPGLSSRKGFVRNSRAALDEMIKVLGKSFELEVV